MSKLIMLVGLPGSGKSTFGKIIQGEGIRLSTDDIIELHATIEGKTYNEVFQDSITTAKKLLEVHLEWALRENEPLIIWDQTNLTVKTRKAKLQKIPEHYEKICLFFDTDFKKILERNEDRRLTGRNVSNRILFQMKDSLQVPTKEEGFDKVYTIKEVAP